MAELVDAPASGAGTRKGVEVRVLFWAPKSHFRTSSNVLKTPRKRGFLWVLARLVSELVQSGLLVSSSFVGIFVGI